MIDTHCHLDADAFDADRAAVLVRAAAAGVTNLLIPATRPRRWRDLAMLALYHGQAVDTRIAIGIHPQCVPGPQLPELPRTSERVDIDKLAENIAAQIAVENDDTTRPPGAPPLVLAVGECGLDGPTGQLELQEQVLRAHVRAARAVKLP